jgi:predicted membrane protein
VLFLRRNITRSLFGIILICAAIVVFGNSLGWWRVEDFNGWWTLFIIIPGVAGLISYGFNVSYTCMVIIGVWLLARAQNWIPSPLADNMVWVIILMLIGLKLIFGSFRGNKLPNNAPVIFDGVKGANDSSNTVNYSAVFGSVEVSNNSMTLCGGSISAIFGGVTLDLRGAVPVDGAVIEANAIFGGAKIFAPQNCRIQISGVPFFGGCDCTAQRPNDPALPLLTVKYSSVFGGVEIK